MNQQQLKHITREAVAIEDLYTDAWLDNYEDE